MKILFLLLEAAATLPFPIVDPHVHFLDTMHLSYPPIVDFLRNRNWTVRDYNHATSGIDVEQVIFMEVICDQALEEAVWIQKLINAGTGSPDYKLSPDGLHGRPAITGVVASARLDKGEEIARQDLIQLIQNVPALKGIRRLLQNFADVNFCLSSNYTGGVRAIERLNKELGLDIFVDIGITWQMLPCVTKLVALFPNTRFLLDHIAKPPIRAGQLEPWATNIAALAAYPNVWVKLSGLDDEAQNANDRFDSWTIPQLTPYIRQVMSAFGAQRTMFAGNWGEVERYSTWRRWFDGLVEILTTLGYEDHLENIFRTNALRFHA